MSGCEHDETFSDGVQVFCSDCGAGVRWLNADTDEWIEGELDSDYAFTFDGFTRRKAE